MQKSKKRYILVSAILILASLACRALATTPNFSVTEPPSPTATITPIPTPLPPRPVEPGESNPDEPVFITGAIPYTSPFFLSTISAPFVLLEDQAGFVRRDVEFSFTLDGQVMGPVEILPDDTLTYSLALPSIPQGAQVDVDQDGEDERGVQVFAIAYWSNIWGGPFLEERDGAGWSNAYTSTITDPERDNEISGGALVVWAPDDQQGFPSGFGPDEMLFTEDDPIESIPAGYNIVDLNQQPFRIYKEARPNITLNEGDIALNDYSDLGYPEAFEALFQKVSVEYPFTSEKNIDWQALYTEFSSRANEVRNDQDFYRLMRDFAWRIPDGHVGIQIEPEVFFNEQGGSFGMILTELSDGRLLVSQVLPNTPAAEQDIQPGAEIIRWGGKPAADALRAVNPYFGPYSTEHLRRVEQAVFLTRVKPELKVEIEYRNPDQEQSTTVTLESAVEYASLFAAIPSLSGDELAAPVEGEVLDGSNLGYIRVNTFSGDYELTASLWEHYLQSLIDNDIEGLIIDIRANGGGSAGLALDFAGYFFDEEIELYTGRYYNEILKDFKPQPHPARIRPAPFQFDGSVAVLIGPYCVSACEGFAHALSQQGRVTLIGHFPTAGAYGEVGRGQYKLPGDYSMQFPTGRSDDASGKLIIEGMGVLPDITVPITAAGALGQVDDLLEAAIKELTQ
jgi:C-terminal processing protease CtpA/Prc